MAGQLGMGDAALFLVPRWRDRPDRWLGWTEPLDDGRYRRWRRFIFKPAVAAAGLDQDVRVYDLRHHRASVLIKSGANIVEAARQLGHSPTVLLDTYAHVIDASGPGVLDVQAEIVKARSALTGS
jgi:integrase